MKLTSLPTALLAASSALHAASLAPDDRQLAAAIDRGRVLAASQGNYSLKKNIAWEVPDARTIDPALGSVDAVLVATPIERATHAGFLAAHDGRQLTVSEARGSERIQPGWLRIILFTHGPDAKDESYVEKFSNARLVFGNDTIVAQKMEHSEPSESTYPLATENRERQVATITFHFNLSKSPKLQATRGRLQFTDDAGRTFDQPIDLSSYP